MEKPLISFIITYYNEPLDLLCECIDSITVLTLTSDEREIIVVDDGSDESPVETLKQFGDAITYIRQKHMGLSEARNRGLQMATGEYIQFIDADDVINIHPYEYCLNTLKAKSPEMIVFDFCSATTPIGDYKFNDQPSQSGSHYMRHNNIHGMAWGYMFKRSVLGDMRFTPGIYHEDEEFTPMLLLRAEDVIVTDAKAYCYYDRPDSITNSSDPNDQQKRLNDFKDILKRLHIAADRMPIDDKTALQRRVAQLTMDYIYQVIRQTCSRKQLESEIKELTRLSLFPLPNQAYTTKYTWFRRMSATSVGRALLMGIIPLTRKER
jgi:glycosyltransferase involved in cell wall biosynthesis